MPIERTDSPATLPDGEVDPDLIYIAVGRAIHAWEEMEEELAELFLKLTATPFSDSALAAYGKAHPRFANRRRAIERAAATFFVGSPDQAKEGRLQSIVAELDELAIERHRIAHGHVSWWGEIPLPREKGYHEVTVTMKFRWAAPFYATKTLRADPVGRNAKSIDSIHDCFTKLREKVVAFRDEL